MDVIECIKTRRSVRVYKEEHVKKEHMDELIHLATLAASATAVEPWGFLLLENKAELDQISEDIKASLLKSFKEKPDMQRYSAMMENPKFHVFHNAPTVLVIYGDEASKWHVKDCTLAAANVMLAANSMGMGSCWIGFADEWMNTEEFKAAHNVPKHFHLVCPLTLGYQVKPLAPPKRKAPIIF